MKISDYFIKNYFVDVDGRFLCSQNGGTQLHY
jgi:hypothetical protein